MSNVAIERVRDADALPPSFFEKVVVTADKIRQRAFELFKSVMTLATAPSKTGCRRSGRLSCPRNPS